MVWSRYIKCLYVYNKIDMCYIEEVDELVRQPYSTVISVHQKLNLDVLLEERRPTQTHS